MLAALQRDLGLTADAARDPARPRGHGQPHRARAAQAARRRVRRRLADRRRHHVHRRRHRRRARPPRSRAAGADAEGRRPQRRRPRRGQGRPRPRRPPRRRPPRCPAGTSTSPANTVVVLARGDAAAAQRVRRRPAASTPRRSASSPRPSSPAPLYDVRGGDAYYIGGGRCSVGFSVTGGFVTAGHCGTTGTATQGFNQVAQGTFAGSSFPGNDYAWVRINANWTPAAVGQQLQRRQRHGGRLARRPRSARRSAGPAPPPAGTAAPCRPRTRRSTTPQGTVTGLTRTNVCAEPGDSGGSLAVRPAGARASPPAAPATARSGGTTYFQPVNEILSAYGLTLRHRRRRRRRPRPRRPAAPATRTPAPAR